jgi:hypothetical protein
MISFKEYCKLFEDKKYNIPKGVKKMVINVEKLKPDYMFYVAKYKNVESKPQTTLVDCLASLVEEYGAEKMGITVEKKYKMQPYYAVLDSWREASEKYSKIAPVGGRGDSANKAAGKLLYNLFKFTKVVEINMPKVMPIDVIKHQIT